MNGRRSLSDSAVSVAVVSFQALFTMLFGNRAVFSGLFIAELGLVFAISGFALRMGAVIAAPLFLLYSALNGVTVSGIPHLPGALPRLCQHVPFHTATVREQKGLITGECPTGIL